MSCRYLITAGPTHEAIDQVRYIANRSSGAMGLAIAQAARDAGHDVTLLLGPVSAAAPPGVRTLRFESTADLSRLLDEHFDSCDVLVMAAAVADYRPTIARQGKIERRAGKLTIEFESTPDLVAACAGRRRDDQYILGFALAEAERLADRAAEKLRRKALDAIVANPLPTMGAADIRATVYTRDGRTYSPPAPGSASPPDTRGSAPTPSAPTGRPIDHTPPSASVTKPTFARWLVQFITDHKR